MRYNIILTPCAIIIIITLFSIIMKIIIKVKQLIMVFTSVSIKGRVKKQTITSQIRDPPG